MLGGCGSAVLAAAFPHVGISLLGVSLAIGLTLTLIHLISIPVTNTSVNPARSTGPAVFVQGWALSQLWQFWVAPLLGGAVGALVHRFVTPGWARVEKPPRGHSPYIISRLKPEPPWLGLTRIENHYVMVPVTDRVNLPNAAMQLHSGHVNPL